MLQNLSSAAVVVGALRINSLRTRNPLIGTLANSEDTGEMQHNTAFHQGSTLFAKT